MTDNLGPDPVGSRVHAGPPRKPPKRPRSKSNQIPQPNPPPTDIAIANLESLVDLQFRPMFSEVFERGRGDIAAFASDFLGMTLHDGQKRWVNSFPWATERSLSSGNRWGKTMIDGVKLDHSAFYQIRDPLYAELTHEYVALNLSLTIDMAKIAWDYAYRAAMESPLMRHFLVEDECKLSPFPILVMGTPRGRSRGFRSEIWARSTSKDAKYLLGRKFDFIVYDEAARDPRGDKILDEVLRMRLADRNGRIDLTSTAAGKNWFYTQFMRGKDNRLDPRHITFYSQTGSSYENPFISHERVKANEKLLAEAWKEQNIYGGFADYMNVFLREQIENCYAGIDYPICRDYTRLEHYLPSHDRDYVMGIDWALKRDQTVILVADASETPARIVFAQGFLPGQKSWDELKAIVVRVSKFYNNAQCVFDATGMAGEIITSDLSNLGMTRHTGYNFAGNNGQAKDALILVAQQALQNRVFIWPYIPELYDQLTLYDRDDKNLETDWVFAFCLMAEAYRQAKLPQSDLLDVPSLIYSTGYQYGASPQPRSQEARTYHGVQIETPREKITKMALTSTGWREIEVDAEDVH